jgi:chromosome partitioning protein
MILLFASGKGGTGKTTNAVQMAQSRAALGRKVLLIDMDKQGSARLWASQRTKLAPDAVPIHCMALLGEGVGKQVTNFAPDFDDVVIDTRGTEARNREMREALLVADKVVTPIKTSLFDSATTLDMVELIEDARAINPKLKAYILLNDCSTHAHDKRDADVRSELEDLPGFSGVLKAQIFHRSVYELVAEKGQAVAEFSRNPQARAEVEALAAEVWS